jgi:hypothetical protein
MTTRDENNPEVAEPREVTHEEVDNEWAESMFIAPVGSKWYAQVEALLEDKSIFVPDMDRREMESLRVTLRRHTSRGIRSRRITYGGQVGRVLALGGERGQPVEDSRHRKHHPARKAKTVVRKAALVREPVEPTAMDEEGTLVVAGVVSE